MYYKKVVQVHATKFNAHTILTMGIQLMQKITKKNLEIRYEMQCSNLYVNNKVSLLGLVEEMAFFTKFSTFVSLIHAYT